MDELIIIMFFAILVMACCLWEARREKKLFKHLCWCFSADPLRLRRYCTNMYHKIFSAQEYLPSCDYRIVEGSRSERSEEENIVRDMLEAFYDNVCSRYFSRSLTPSRESRKLHDDEYFMYLFEEYLRYHFESKDLYKTEVTESGERIERITALGIVYYKLILISSMYNRSKDRTIEVPQYGYTDNIIELLDKERNSHK